ncbi:hypothetical protein ABXJ56_13285 [Microbacterium chocolatum]|uniref:hypothetical protein n=1 Tax=Microbacterium aurantiacum TaxID=162393 RepID=UPI00338D9165
MTTLTAPHRLTRHSRLDRTLLALARMLESHVSRRTTGRSFIRDTADITHADRRACARACGQIGILPR